MAEYYNVTTNIGDAEIANAIATATKLNITHIAFGDGNGAVPTPNEIRTTLVHEVHRQAITKYERHKANANWLVIETIIPSNVGGFTIREMGIIANGKLISHGSHAPFEKVADPSGVSEYRLKFTQNITDGSVVEITLDESLIYASQAWVEENFIKRNEIVDNLITDDATKPVSAKQAKVLQDNKLGKTENAVSATKLKYSRSITLTKGVTGTAYFDGSSNIQIEATVANLGVGNGIATLDPTGKVPSNQLPSYVDDVLEYATTSDFPATGETGKIYVETTGNTTYRWSGSAYVKITSGEVSSVAGKNGVVTLVKADVGLGNVDNTADSRKSVASAVKLTTARTISLTGDATGSLSFDGSGNASAALTLASSGAAAGTYKSVTVDAKGRVTSGNDVVTGLVTSTSATGVTNVATTNTNTYLNITEKVGTATASAGASSQIAGAGTVTVSSNTSGKIIITGSQDITGNAATATELATASGNAPSYAARAWVNFNGTGTVKINGSGNVSSITDNGTGDYTVNFSTAMPNTNYATVFGVGDDLGGSSLPKIITVGNSTTAPKTKTVNACRIGFGGDVYDFSAVFFA